MRKILFFLYICSLSLLHAEESQYFSEPADILADAEAPLANDHGVPSALIYGCVNVITGDFQYTVEDLALCGSTEISLDILIKVVQEERKIRFLPLNLIQKQNIGIMTFRVQRMKSL